jgi:hypothetical protein
VIYLLLVIHLSPTFGWHIYGCHTPLASGHRCTRSVFLGAQLFVSFLGAHLASIILPFSFYPPYFDLSIHHLALQVQITAASIILPLVVRFFPPYFHQSIYHLALQVHITAASIILPLVVLIPPSLISLEYSPPSPPSPNYRCIPLGRYLPPFTLTFALSFTLNLELTLRLYHRYFGHQNSLFAGIHGYPEVKPQVTVKHHKFHKLYMSKRC